MPLRVLSDSRQDWDVTFVENRVWYSDTPFVGGRHEKHPHVSISLIIPWTYSHFHLCNFSHWTCYMQDFSPFQNQFHLFQFHPLTWQPAVSTYTKVSSQILIFQKAFLTTPVFSDITCTAYIISWHVKWSFWHKIINCFYWTLYWRNIPKQVHIYIWRQR